MRTKLTLDTNGFESFASLSLKKLLTLSLKNLQKSEKCHFFNAQNIRL